MILAVVCAVLPPKFVQIPAGEYLVGKSGRLANYSRKVKLAAFEIAATETTNAEFAEFVKATGYVTDAERLHNAMVFRAPLKEFRWIQDPTANWRYPNGKRMGGIQGKELHPVTSISYRDAVAYCKWKNVRLPTLDEWEVASRAGSKKDYFFGSDASQILTYANVWHGRDHLKSDRTDGYTYTSPVGSFDASPNGLFDIYGNVFEFCSGLLPGEKPKRFAHARGGSWWCSRNSCGFFNSVDVGTADIAASFSNQGFRVAKSR